MGKMHNIQDKLFEFYVWSPIEISFHNLLRVDVKDLVDTCNTVTQDESTLPRGMPNKTTHTQSMRSQWPIHKMPD